MIGSQKLRTVWRRNTRVRPGCRISLQQICACGDQGSSITERRGEFCRSNADGGQRTPTAELGFELRRARGSTFGPSLGRGQLENVNLLPALRLAACFGERVGVAARPERALQDEDDA